MAQALIAALGLLVVHRRQYVLRQNIIVAAVGLKLSRTGVMTLPMRYLHLAQKAALLVRKSYALSVHPVSNILAHLLSMSRFIIIVAVKSSPRDRQHVSYANA